MKLAEALRLKVDYEIQLSRLKDRVREETIVEDGEDPSTQVYSTLQGYDALAAKLLRLNVAINRANMENTVTYASYYDNIKDIMAIGDTESNSVSKKVTTSTKSVMEALVERDRLSYDIRSYKIFLTGASIGPRDSIDDVKKKSNLDATKLRKRMDAMSKYLRLVDTRIQENNWVIDFEFE